MELIDFQLIDDVIYAKPGLMLVFRVFLDFNLLNFRRCMMTNALILGFSLYILIKVVIFKPLRENYFRFSEIGEFCFWLLSLSLLEMKLMWNLLL